MQFVPASVLHFAPHYQVAPAAVSPSSIPGKRLVVNLQPARPWKPTLVAATSVVERQDAVDIQALLVASATPSKREVVGQQPSGPSGLQLHPPSRWVEQQVVVLYAICTAVLPAASEVPAALQSSRLQDRDANSERWHGSGQAAFTELEGCHSAMDEALNLYKT